MQILGETSPQLPVIRAVHSLANQGGPDTPRQLLPNLVINPVAFNAAADIAVWTNGWASSFALRVQDPQSHHLTQGE